MLLNILSYRVKLEKTWLQSEKKDSLIMLKEKTSSSTIDDYIHQNIFSIFYLLSTIKKVTTLIYFNQKHLHLDDCPLQSFYKCFIVQVLFTFLSDYTSLSYKLAAAIMDNERK